MGVGERLVAVMVMAMRIVLVLRDCESKPLLSYGRRIYSAAALIAY